MKNTIQLIFFCYFSLLICSCSNSQNNIEKINTAAVQISDTLIYNTLTSILQQDLKINNLKTNVFLNKENIAFPFSFSNDSLELTKLSDLFTTKDIEFIFAQKKQFESFLLVPNSIKNITIVPFDSSANLKQYNTVSFPLFNLNKSIAIIRKSHYCGAFCGQQSTYIYSLKPSGWVLVKTIQEVFF